ncbi:MAG TPA: bifunctional methylenetetrahydrofolate dehydrogenase/methenyltetrahydrofolate cyclohydrolase FolD [Stellaceae bacterium]|jgi:methylenetetrahydrofolate dehydrogenase (NADP+)/methenyltetrahydrofolate cyclohydrolase|nr:bifunctional methylenetetrahydrofolate dehydrogenase/methenyltetrahydrofolate cyclohydrolase FolD [Stellaceae bacterium]
MTNATPSLSAANAGSQPLIIARRSAAAIIDGKAAAERLRASLAFDIAAMKRDGVTPGLAVVLVGDNPASEVYVRNKKSQAAAAGIASFAHDLPASTDQATLLALIARLNADPDVDGILVQLPLPAHIDAQSVINAIAPAKDVDGFHPTNAGALLQGTAALVPCTPLGCLMLLREQLGDLAGAEAVVVGRSNIVGKPMAALLTAADCTVTIAHSKSRDQSAICRRADILIAAIGRPAFIKSDWIKPGATVIDVGINRIAGENGRSKLVGDVDFAAASQVAGAITPVPGGVGPMTIACLLHNTVIACRRRRGVINRT